MRWLSIALIVLILLLQYPLWFGKGGWFKVWTGEEQLLRAQESNHRLEVRNAGLDAEVRDLKLGYDAIEERARFELGFIKDGEVFVQFPDASAPVAPAVAAPPAQAAGRP